MLCRIAQHYVGIQTGSEKKYRLLAEIQKKGHTINFDVLYYAKSKGYQNIQKEIGQKEGEYIRRIMPVLNTQIPKESDWTKYDFREVSPDEIRKLFE